MAELSFEALEEAMLRERQKYTPEYFKELALKSYNDDREYPENFSNWYYHIKSFGDFAHAEVVSNQIFTFEETEAMQETDIIEKVDWNKINEILKPTIEKMDRGTIYNIKNGCFSNKFDFETCLVTRETLAKQLWKINYNSTMYSTGGYTELVVRELIPKNINKYHLTIYNGMPLRTEVRVFYNMETKKIEYIVDYWDYNYCKDNLHNLNDKIIFDAFHNQVKTSIPNIRNHWMEFEDVSNEIRKHIHTLEFDDELKGIWSIDFMYDYEDGNKIYLIDMARGFRSAYWNFNKLTTETQKKLKEEYDYDKI